MEPLESRPSQPATPAGIWLPLVTPFREGALDETSLVRLARHYNTPEISGLILAATTGEGLVLDDHETARLVETVAAAQPTRKPI